MDLRQLRRPRHLTHLRYPYWETGMLLRHAADLISEARRMPITTLKVARSNTRARKTKQA